MGAVGPDSAAWPAQQQRQCQSTAELNDNMRKLEALVRPHGASSLSPTEPPRFFDGGWSQEVGGEAPPGENAGIEFVVDVNKTFLDVKIVDHSGNAAAPEDNRHLRRWKTDPVPEAPVFPYRVYQIPAAVAPPHPAAAPPPALPVVQQMMTTMPAMWPAGQEPSQAMWPAGQETIWQQPFQSFGDEGTLYCYQQGCQYVPFPDASGPDMEIINKVQFQMEHYFSDENLVRDSFFHKRISEDHEGWLHVDYILDCNMIKKAGASWKHVAEAANRSELLELRPDLYAVRRADNRPLPPLQAGPTSPDLGNVEGQKRGKELLNMLLQKEPAEALRQQACDIGTKEALARTEQQQTAAYWDEASCGGSTACSLAAAAAPQPRGSIRSRSKALEKPPEKQPVPCRDGGKLPTEEEMESKDQAVREKAIAMVCCCKAHLLKHCEDKGDKNNKKAPSGTRLVQKALEKGDKKVQLKIAGWIKGNVRKFLQSGEANYVIQKVVQVLPASDSAFVAEEIRGYAVTVARQQTGCRGIQRLIEHCPEAPGTKAIIQELFLKSNKDHKSPAEAICSLCTHVFAHFVMQSILEHYVKDEQQRRVQRRVAEALLEDLERMGCNKFGSYVVEKALELCEPEVQARLIKGLTEPECIRKLAVSRGVHVLRKISERSEELKHSVARALSDEVWRWSEDGGKAMEKNKHGQELLQKLGLRPASE